MALSIVEPPLNALLFLTASIDEVDAEASKTFRRLELHSELQMLAPAVFKLFVKAYRDHLAPNIKKFGRSQTQLAEGTPLWSTHVKRWFTEVEKQWHIWYQKNGASYSKADRAVLKLFPTRLKAVSTYLGTLSSNPNAALIPYVPAMLKDILKALESVRHSIRVVSCLP